VTCGIDLFDGKNQTSVCQQVVLVVEIVTLIVVMGVLILVVVILILIVILVKSVRLVEELVARMEVVLSFQQFVGLVKKKKFTAEDKEQLKFVNLWVYD
jgi:hypothetical protein